MSKPTHPISRNLQSLHERVGSLENHLGQVDQELTRIYADLLEWRGGLETIREAQLRLIEKWAELEAAVQMHQAALVAMNQPRPRPGGGVR